MKIYHNPPRSDWPVILQRPVLKDAELDEKVKVILEDIKMAGDHAVKKYTVRFDKVGLDNLQVSEEEINSAEAIIPDNLKSAIKVAKANITTFHLAQQEQQQLIHTMRGITCWRKSVGIQKVGLYIPGGSAPLFSTILMLGVPARLAGCEEIVLCTPPKPDGSIDPVILFTAKLVGIRKVFRIGGVQAIGALAFGTESVPQVYKIFGPGNQFVTAAKQLVQRHGVAIDIPAGPSEVLVVADDTADPEFVAADLLSQAEHGADSQVILLALDRTLIDKVTTELEKQLKTLPRRELAAQAIRNSAALWIPDKATALDLVNAYAPEHLIVSLRQPRAFAEGIINAGSVFIGNFSPESVGDYASGTNHTLPTNGYARMYSGVSLDSFCKKITFQELTREGLQAIGPVVEQMAEAESLIAHKRAVSIRLQKIADS